MPRDRLRLRQACLSLGLLLGLISPAAAQVDKTSPAPRVEVEVANGLLTLEADGAPLAEVLQAIGEAGSFRVVLRGAFATPIRDSFAGQPLERAVQRLVGGHSLIILHEGRDPASGAAALAEIRVIESPPRPAPARRPSGEPVRRSAEATQHDVTDDPPIDRLTFRQANSGLPPPNRDDVLLELGDPDRATRVAAVPMVASLGPRAAIKVLAGVLEGEEDPLVRSRAIAALTRLERPGGWTLLRRRALADEDASVRVQALNALASLAGERAIGVLGQALRQDPEPEVRVGAIRALQRVGGAGRRYVEQAATTPDAEIGTAAERALAAWPRPE